MRYPSFKNIVFGAVTISAITLLVFFGFNKANDISGDKSTNDILSPREQSIKSYIAGKDNFKRVSYDRKDLSLVVYRNSEGVWDREKKNEVHNHVDFPYDRGGIILFDGDKIVWESEEPFQKIYPETVDVRDIDNDGINEISVIDLIGEKLTGCAVYIYKYVNHGMDLISPYTDISGADPRNKAKTYTRRITKFSQCNKSFSPDGLVDFNNDKILEILVRQTSHDYTPTTLIWANESQFYVVYKWNDVSYEPWLELPIPPGKDFFAGSIEEFMRDAEEVIKK